MAFMLALLFSVVRRLEPSSVRALREKGFVYPWGVWRRGLRYAPQRCYMYSRGGFVFDPMIRQLWFNDRVVWEDRKEINRQIQSANALDRLYGRVEGSANT